jgi:hypothetical protein
MHSLPRELKEQTLAEVALLSYFFRRIIDTFVQLFNEYTNVDSSSERNSKKSRPVCENQMPIA